MTPQERNVLRRLRYRERTCTRSEYYWPETATITPYTRRYGNADLISTQIAAMRQASRNNDTQTYVSTWCALNHLKG